MFSIKDTNLESRLTADLNEDNKSIVDAETIVNDYISRENTLTLTNDKMQDKACYMPRMDTVVVPMITQFNSSEEYYSVLFHELAHSTMLEKRCNRKKDDTHTHFGSEEYSREELVAEMSSAMLCSVAGIEKNLDNSVAYLQAWIKFLNNDNKAIVYAAAKAEKATRYILNQ